MTDLDAAERFFLARWLLPVAEAPVEYGCLHIAGDKILGVLSRREYDALPEHKKINSEDFGEAVILPGLLNLHTHLDYSNLKHFDNDSPFFDWIKGLIGNSWQWTADQWLNSAQNGASEILLSGSSMIVDSSYSGAAAKAVAKSGLRGLVGLELFGIDESDADNAFEQWLKKYETFHQEAAPEVKAALQSKRLKITIAPHTPYSVCPALISKAAAWAADKALPLLIHISESRAECRWLSSADQNLDRFLMNAFQLKEMPYLPWRGEGLSPVQHLDKYGLLSENMLAAHLVQANQSDIDILARNKVAAVHCPRSNSRLRNGVAPIGKWLEAGLRMGIGTDSAASTDDLDVRAEARFAWDLQRAVNPEFDRKADEAIYYLTLAAANAVKMDSEIGSLSPGKKSDFAIFSLAGLPEIARKRPADCLIYGGASLQELYIDGIKRVSRGYIAGTQAKN
ncbi:MAG: amidohydrolase family protein [Candidatus Obscuribacterales bacterium]|nr:amidohydrolase family protein [Candidatus Obscuribacterales bacterium]